MVRFWDYQKLYQSLELLSDNEMELASAVLAVVEAVAPVDAQQADHREEDADAHTGAPLDLERVELTDVRPAVTALEEAEDIDGGLRFKDHRITELDRELVVDVTRIREVGTVRGGVHRGEGIVFVTTQGDDFRTVGLNFHLWYSIHL